MKDKIFLGIDPGLNKTGWGFISCINVNSFQYIASGIIKTNKTLKQAERLLHIYNGVTEIVETFKPNFSAIENTYVNANYESSLKLAQGKGSSLIALAQKGLCINEYPAKTIKKVVTGLGNASKDQVKKMVEVLLPSKHTTSHDENDALAIAICDLLSRTMKSMSL
tara:strand:- start:31 stop:528 length:498 start_codon:yes stop_codon:yes gene_type:complete